MNQLRERINNELRKRVYSKTNGKCIYCAEAITLESMHVDHLYPFSKGGSNDIHNLMPSCRYCNLHKSDKLVAPMIIRKEVIKEVEVIREKLIDCRNCIILAKSVEVMNESMHSMNKHISNYVELLHKAEERYGKLITMWRNHESRTRWG